MYSIDVRYSDSPFSSYSCYIISGFKYKDDAEAVADFLTNKWAIEASLVGSEEYQFCLVKDCV